jgi:hypothetical protein
VNDGVFDALAAFGVALIAVGVALWSVPAGVVVAGLGFVTAAVLGARAFAQNKQRPAAPAEERQAE